MSMHLSGGEAPMRLPEPRRLAKRRRVLAMGLDGGGNDDEMTYINSGWWTLNHRRLEMRGHTPTTYNRTNHPSQDTTRAVNLRANTRARTETKVAPKRKR